MPTITSIVETSEHGVVFVRELYDAANEPSQPHEQQTLSVPGIADFAERNVRELQRAPIDEAPRLIIGGHASREFHKRALRRSRRAQRRSRKKGGETAHVL